MARQQADPERSVVTQARRRTRVFAATVALLIAMPLSPLVGELRGQELEPTDLDPTHQFSWCAAYGMDGTGRAVGTCLISDTGDFSPALYAAGVATALPILPGDEDGYAFDLNDDGVIVGSSVVYVPDGAGTSAESHPVRWTRGVPVDLRTLVTSGDATLMRSATGINAAGSIVGDGVEPTTGALRGYVFDDGTVTDIGALNGSLAGRTYPSRISALGVVVGGSESSSGFDHAFRWERGVMTDLHSLAGIAGNTSRAFGVNRFGAVCGSADFTIDASDSNTAAVWIDDTAVDLGSLGGSDAWASGINDFGAVVGTALQPGGSSVAFRWRLGEIDILNDLLAPGSGWVISGAEDIDNDGRIIGTGILGGAARPVLLVPQCDGGYSVYGAGCPGTGGLVPMLQGHACPTPDEPFALAVAKALPGAPGGLFVGTGAGVMQIKPNCALQVLPLVGGHFALPVAGDGSLFLAVRLGPATPAFSAYVQYLVADPGAPFGVASTNPLRIDFR